MLPLNRRVGVLYRIQMSAQAGEGGSIRKKKKRKKKKGNGLEREGEGRSARPPIPAPVPLPPPATTKHPLLPMGMAAATVCW